MTCERETGMATKIERLSNHGADVCLTCKGEGTDEVMGLVLPGMTEPPIEIVPCDDCLDGEMEALCESCDELADFVVIKNGEPRSHVCAACAADDYQNAA